MEVGVVEVVESVKFVDVSFKKVKFMNVNSFFFNFFDNY